MPNTHGRLFHDYALTFAATDEPTVALGASDRAQAFDRARSLVRERRAAVLFEDGVPLAQISYSEAGFWTVSCKR